MPLPLLSCCISGLGPEGLQQYVRVYLDDLLCIFELILEDHLEKLKEVLRQLCDAGLKVNAA
jgi:hypothetical protein